MTLPPPVEVLLARRELALEQRQAELRRENGILFYTPHDKQNQFHYAGWIRRRYARTGNRFGKSEMGAAEDVAFALGYRPWIAEGITLRTLGLTDNVPPEFWDVELRYLGIPRHSTKGLIVTTDWDKSTEVFTSQESGANQGKLFKYIPKSAFIEATKNHSGAIDRVVVKSMWGGNSVIHLDTVKSYKQNPLAFESGAWDWAHFDEPVPEGLYKALSRGLVDRGGKAWFTCTPLTEPWLDTKFVPDLESQSREELDVIESKDYWMMTGSMYDNPYNKKEDIDFFLSELTEEERETRISGRPASYSGIVYKEFVWDLHVRREPPPGWTSWEVPPPAYALRFAIDYHPRKPHHVLFIATSPLEVHYVYAEVFLSCLMSELVIEIRNALGNRESTVPGLIDPLADTPNRVTDITPLEEVIRLGLPVVPATKDPHNGILAVKALLKQRDRANTPTLVVNPACRRFLFEISRGFIWDADSNKPEKKNDDAMENFYRLALQGLFYVEPSSASDYAPISRRDHLETSVVDATEFFHREPSSPAFDHAKRYRR